MADSPCLNTEEFNTIFGDYDVSTDSSDDSSNLSSDDSIDDSFDSDSNCSIESENTDTSESESAVDNSPRWRRYLEDIDVAPFVAITGPSDNAKTCENELEFFELLFDEDCIDHIASETNKHAANLQDKNGE